MHLFHRYVAIAAEPYQSITASIMDRMTGEVTEFETPLTKSMTKVLMRCPCGAVKTKDLEGFWTIDQLKP